MKDRVKLTDLQPDRDSKAEVDKAFSLFTGGDDEGPITFAHLKKVARTLNENVSDDVLREMLSEASSGVDGSVVSKYVGCDVIPNRPI